MSNPSPAHQPAGTPTGGQFAPSARAEDPTVQLESPDGTADLDPVDVHLIDAELVDADAQLPTDPMALIAALDAERARESAETHALQYEADQTLDKDVYYALEDAKTTSAEQGFRRYRLLANAVTGAGPTARGPYLVALIGQLDAERRWERDEVNALRDTTDDSDDQADYQALEDAEKEFSDHESVRYRLLAEAVIDAARPAPQPIQVPRPALDSTGFGYDRNAFATMIAGMQKDAPAPEPPTDPMALIAYLDDERTVENTEIDELRSAADESQHPYDYQALEDAVAQSGDREFRRYKMLADAVQDAARPAPRPITVQDLRNAWTNDQYLPDTEREALQALPDRDVRESLDTADRAFDETQHSSVIAAIRGDAVRHNATATLLSR